MADAGYWCQNTATVELARICLRHIHERKEGGSGGGESLSRLDAPCVTAGKFDDIQIDPSRSSSGPMRQCSSVKATLTAAACADWMQHGRKTLILVILFCFHHELASVIPDSHKRVKQP